MVIGSPAPNSGALLVFDASVQPQRQATVAAQSAGTVLTLTVKAGDRVKAGQVLARMDDRNASAGVQQGEAGIAQAQAALRLSRTQLERSRELRAQGYVSQAALDSAEQQHQAAEAGLRQARAGASQATLARTFTTVTAPFEGVVLATHLDAGDLATPGRPIFTLYAPGALRAVVQVPASQAARVRAAQRVEVQLPDQRWVVPVRKANLPGADAVSQTVEWRLDLAGADSAQLVPGQAVRVRFAVTPGTAPTQAALPMIQNAAVLRRGELTAVYVVQGSQFVLRAVRTGTPQGDSTEVLAGLKPGERIAIDAIRAGLTGARP